MYNFEIHPQKTGSDDMVLDYKDESEANTRDYTAKDFQCHDDCESLKILNSSKSNSKKLRGEEPATSSMAQNRESKILPQSGVQNNRERCIRDINSLALCMPSICVD